MIRTIHASIPLTALIVIDAPESLIEERTKEVVGGIQAMVEDAVHHLNADGLTISALKPKVTTKVDYGRGSEAHEPEAGTSGS